MKYRINKFLAFTTDLSRRKADILIKVGKISINGINAKAGDFVDSVTDVVLIDSQKVIKSDLTLEYYLLNKPEKVLSTVTDDRGRATVMDYIKSRTALVPVGRLDYMSTGLIILTNDGDLTYKLTHPKYHVPKTYFVRVKEKINPSQLNKIKRGGITIENHITSPTDINQIDNFSFEITLYEGIKRQIRESCKFVGLTVIELKRISIGQLNLADLKKGQVRPLNQQELMYIKLLKQQDTT